MGSTKEGKKKGNLTISFKPPRSLTRPDLPKETLAKSTPSTPSPLRTTLQKIENAHLQGAADSDDESIGSAQSRTTSSTTSTWSGVNTRPSERYSAASSCCTTPESSGKQTSSSSLQPATPSSVSTNTTSKSSSSQSSCYEDEILDACFQCTQLGLRCSYTSRYQRLPPPGLKGRWCSRCLRNGEPFCILQEGLRGKFKYVDEVHYGADGIPAYIVQNKVEELKSAKTDNFQFMLPGPFIWRRKLLRSIYPPLVDEEPKSEWESKL